MDFGQSCATSTGKILAYSFADCPQASTGNLFLFCFFSFSPNNIDKHSVTEEGACQTSISVFL